MKLKRIICAVLGMAAVAGCSEWTGTAPVDIEASHPWERDPRLWEEYMENLRAYKQRKHSLVYVRFDNAAENPGSEKNFMRCLPDSLDYVSLTNAANFSVYDAEDMEWMQRTGTKVLYQVDLSQQPDLERAIRTVKENGLSGFSFTGLGKDNRDRAAEIISRLSGNGLLVCEGNPRLLAAEDLDRIDLFVLPTETIENSYDLNNLLQDVLDLGVARDRVLLSVSMKGSWYDTSNAEQPAVPSMADNVVTYGPLAGLAIYDIMSDYYNYDGNWLTIRSTISRLNP